MPSTHPYSPCPQILNKLSGGWQWGASNWKTEKSKNVRPLLEPTRHVTKKETRILPSFLLHPTHLPQLTQQPVPQIPKLINTFCKPFPKQVLLDWIKKYMQLLYLIMFCVLQPPDKGCLQRFFKTMQRKEDCLFMHVL